MSNPAYLFLTDENGSPMVGPSLVSGREGAIIISISKLTPGREAPFLYY